MRKITNTTSPGTFDLSAAALVYALNWKAKRKRVHHCTEMEQHGAEQMCGCSAPGKSNRKCDLSEVRGALTSATGTPSGGRQCSTIIAFRGTSAPWGSCSKFFLRSEGEKKTKHEMHFCMHKRTRFKISQGLTVTYKRFGRLPCGSWRFPGGSMPRTDTSNPPGHENLPPADVTR